MTIEIALLMFAGFGLAVLLATVGVTLLLVRFARSSRTAIVGGGLSMPILLFVWGIYDICYNLGPDSTAPGNLLIGGVIAIAIAIPIAFLASFLTARYHERRHGRLDR